MTRHVVLHVGAMKTGTTFLQSVLAEHRGSLAAAGVRFPASSVHAVRAVIRGPAQGPPDPTRWRELAASAPGDLLISMEFLGFAGPERIRLLLEPLAGDEVTVVVGVRDQRQTLAAQWQTHCRNRGVLAWSDYLRAIRGEGDAGVPGVVDARRTWDRAQQIPRLLDRWSGVGVRRVVVVTVPPPGAGPEVLWGRFAAAARIPPFDVDVGRARTNPSLGHASCELLRRVNAHLADLPAPVYRRRVRVLCEELLVHRRHEEPGLRPDRAALERALAANDGVRERLAGGLELHGEPGDLPVAEEVDLTDAPIEASVCPEPALEAAARAAYAHLAGSTPPPRPSADDLVRQVARHLRRGGPD